MSSANTSPKPHLRLVASNAKPRFSAPAWRLPYDKAPVILPPLNVFNEGIKWEFECKLLGVTTGQRNLVWRLAIEEGTAPRCSAYLRSCNRVFKLWNLLEAALDWERREMLAILLGRYPRAARRILKSYVRREG